MHQAPYPAAGRHASNRQQTLPPTRQHNPYQVDRRTQVRVLLLHPDRTSDSMQPMWDRCRNSGDLQDSTFAVVFGSIDATMADADVLHQSTSGIPRLEY